MSFLYWTWSSWTSTPMQSRWTYIHWYSGTSWCCEQLTRQMDLLKNDQGLSKFIHWLEIWIFDNVNGYLTIPMDIYPLIGNIIYRFLPWNHVTLVPTMDSWRFQPSSVCRADAQSQTCGWSLSEAPSCAFHKTGDLTFSCKYSRENWKNPHKVSELLASCWSMAVCTVYRSSMVKTGRMKCFTYI